MDDLELPDDTDEMDPVEIREQATQMVLEHLGRGIELWQVMDQPGAGLWSEAETDAVHALANDLVKELAATLANGWRPPAQVMAEPNALLGDQPIHACQLPAAETCPRDIPVVCACGKQWMRRGLIGWRPVEKATTE